MSIFKRLTYPVTKWLAKNRLQKLYRETAASPKRVIQFGPDDKFILFSDCHRGDNSWKDDYAPNRNLHLNALRYYLQREFTYIEMGDGDELFEIKEFDAIAYAHRDIFYYMREFYCEPPAPENPDTRKKKQNPGFYMLFGNHDIQRRSPEVVRKQLHQFFIEYKGQNVDMFPDLEVYEGLILRYQQDGDDLDMFLVHGHQGDWFNDYLWWLALVTVRYIWGPLQQFVGWRDPTMPPKPYYINKWGVQQRIMEWTAEENQVLICGHTHHAHFPKPQDEAHYFNTGSCVHPRAITGIEIQDGTIALVKWEMAPRLADGVMHVERTVLVEPEPILAYKRNV